MKYYVLSVRRRLPKYINKTYPQEWAVFGRNKHGEYVRFRGTAVECLEWKEMKELQWALHAMTEGTQAEGEKLCPQP